MADDDEIDILGDFSLDSCLPKTDRGVPSCSEFLQCDYTVHPQWLLDSSTMACWLDSPPNVDNVQRTNSDQKRLASAGSDDNPPILGIASKWTAADRRLLQRGLNMFGHDIKRISDLIATKSEAEVQLLIETEYGVLLDTPSAVAISSEAIVNVDGTTIPNVAQEEIITDHEIPSSIEEAMSKVNTANPTVSILSRKPQIFKSILKNSVNVIIKPNKSLLKPNVILDIAKKRKTDVFDTGGINHDVLYYEDDFLVDGSESIIESTTVRKLPISKSSARNINSDMQGGNTKSANRRRRRTTSTHKFEDIQKYKISKFNISLTINKRKYNAAKTETDKALVNRAGSDDAVPKMQIVTGSGQALPLSEGEQVIKIEKIANSEAESDIEIDIESDDEALHKVKCNRISPEEAGIQKVVETGNETLNQHRKVELARKRKKKIHLDGDGGYTIRHTEAGDVYEIANEPKPLRGPRKQTIQLTYCKSFNSENPAPYHIQMLVSSLLLMDLHAHTSRAEVMGLLGGEYQPHNSTLIICAYEPCDSAASSGTHCDMCPVSQSQASESLLNAGYSVVGWHHSHPRFPPQPSAQDAASQGQLQRSTRAPFVGLITSQHWPPGRTATQYKCLRVETIDNEEYESGTLPVAYQFSVKLHSDIDLNSLPELLSRMKQLATRELSSKNNLFNNIAKDVCPDTRITYLEKFISSARHHLKSSGYAEEDIVFRAAIKGMQDIFR